MILTIRNEFIPIAVLGLILLALIALGVQGLPAPLPLLRLLLGLVFVLFVPGYTLQAALFPRADDLDGPERLALSFGLSVAVVPPIALVLDKLPWGIRLWPIVIGEGLLIGVCSLIAFARRRRLLAGERFLLVVEMDMRGWWAAQDRTNRVLYAILAGALLTAAVSATAIIVLPRPGDYFTEFYILGKEGLAEDYPREAVVGEPLGVTIGLVNHEREERVYRVEVWAVDPWTEGKRVLVNQTGPITLPRKHGREWPLTWHMPWAGDDQIVEFLLYTAGEPEPYRQLRLWLNVKEAPNLAPLPTSAVTAEVTVAPIPTASPTGRLTPPPAPSATASPAASPTPTPAGQAILPEQFLALAGERFSFVWVDRGER